MLFDPKHEYRLDRLTDELRFALTLTPELLAHVIASACTRLPALSKTRHGVRFDQMVKSGAWSDAALMLIQLELPAWKLRRLVLDDGEWLCSLSRQPNLPVEIDDTADASHKIMPLAILSAFLEAQRRPGATQQARLSVPQITSSADRLVNCDNFS
jgi:hypothetical protein